MFLNNTIQNGDARTKYLTLKVLKVLLWTSELLFYCHDCLTPVRLCATSVDFPKIRLRPLCDSR